MTRQQLAAIMHQRYFKYLIGLLILMIGLQAGMGLQKGRDWQRDNRYYHSIGFVQHFKEKPSDYVGNDDIKGLRELKVSLTNYQKEALTFFRNDDYSDVSMMMAWLAGICLTAGLLTFMYDRRTHFDTFLFGLAASRRSIYWAKIKPVILTVLTGIIVGQASYYAVLKTMLAPTYFKLNLVNTLQHEVALLILMGALYILGSFLGLVVGELVTLLVGAYGFLFTLLFSIDNFEDIWRFIGSHQAEQYTFNPESNHVFINRVLNTQYNGAVYKNSGHYILIISIIVASLLVLWLGQRIYRKSSLEQQTQVVTMDWIKWPLLIICTLYVAFLMAMNGFFSRLPYELLIAHEKYLLIWYFIRDVIIVGIVGWLFINRPWQRRKKRLRGFKISRKIN